MKTEDHIAKVVVRCLTRAYHASLVRIMNVIGVEDTVAMLRRDADALEAASPALEAARGRKPQVQA